MYNRVHTYAHLRKRADLSTHAMMIRFENREKSKEARREMVKERETEAFGVTGIRKAAVMPAVSNVASVSKTSKFAVLRAKASDSFAPNLVSRASDDFVRKSTIGAVEVC
eukprot:2149020-Pleurochrysis_carterae.AAC.2